jgi:hypothetical protein
MVDNYTKRGNGMSMQEFDGNACPNCLDVMDSNATQLRPIWSDYYDDVVCLTCAEEYV